MLEYYDENIWYIKKNKRKTKKIKKAFVFLIILSIFALLFYHVKVNVTKNVLSYCEEYSKAKCSEIINNSILFTINDTVAYSDLVNIEKNQNNEIILISANSQKINRLSSETIKLIKSNLSYDLSKGIPIPFMTFSGIKTFSGYGREINFKTVNVNSVFCEFNSDFSDAGINQTLHKISVTIKCFLDVNLFLESKQIEVSQDILISETVLVGKIPDLYLNNSLFK